MGNFNPKAVLKLAQEARHDGNHDLAAKYYCELALYLNAKKKNSEALSLCDRAEKHSKHPRIKLTRVILEHENGSLDKAKATMNSFIENVISLNKMDEYTSYIEKDLKHFPKYKRQYYIKMLKLDRTSVLPFQGLARAEVELNEPTEAIKIILRGLKVDSEDAILIELLSRALKQTDNPATLAYVKRFEEGKISLEDLKLLVSPKEKKESFEVKPATDEVKDLDTMIRELEAVLGKRVEDDPDTIQPLISEFRNKADKILGGDSHARMDMALAFLEMSLYKEAKEELKKIEKTEECYLEAQALLAETLLREDSVMECLEVLQSMLRSPSLTRDMKLDGLYKLIKVYSELGDYPEALEKADEIESIQSDFRDVRSIKRSLSKKVGQSKKSA